MSRRQEYGRVGNCLLLSIVSFVQDCFVKLNEGFKLRLTTVADAALWRR